MNGNILKEKICNVAKLVYLTCGLKSSQYNANCIKMDLGEAGKLQTTLPNVHINIWKALLEVKVKLLNK